MNKNGRNREFCVYKYTTDYEEIIYIGKTDNLLRDRIEAHAKEDKFFPYLDCCKIEYIELTNKVETDIVEKFLINKYKPILNEKDKIENLSLVNIEIPKWLPYDLKKIKDEEIYINQRNIAIQNQNFFDQAYTAFLEKKNSFCTEFLHPTGLLPTKDNTLMRITTPNVLEENGVYKQILSIDAKKYFQNPFFHQVLIWLPVSEYNNQTPGMEKYKTLLTFAKILEKFKENGFLDEDDTFGFCVLYLSSKYANEDIYHFFKPFFYKEFMYGESSYIEINIEGFKHLDEIIENISRKLLTEFRKNDIIPY